MTMKSLSRWIVCAACAALVTACSRGPGTGPGGKAASGPGPYVTDAQIVALAQKVPFPLMIPSSLPGNPEVVDATVLNPPAAGQSQQGPVMCGIGFGTSDHGVLSIVESNGGQDVPKSGVSGLKQVEVDPSRHLEGT